MVFPRLLTCLPFLGIVLALIAPSVAVSATGSRVLFLVAPNFDHHDLSQYTTDLEARGLDVQIHFSAEPEIHFFEFGERVYDHIIITLPSSQKSLGPAFNSKPLLDFVEAGGNIMVLLNPSQHALAVVRELGQQLDILLPSRDLTLVDHFNYDPKLSPVSHDAIILDPSTSLVAPYVASIEASAGKIIYPKGSAISLGNNILVFPVLRASETAYLYSPSEEPLLSEMPYVTGTQAFLTVGFQARNNGRILFVGSSALFSNEAFENLETSNRDLAVQLSKWVFQEKSVIKLTSVTHNLVNSTELNPSIYRVKEEVEYQIGLSEFVEGEWVPFITDDVQLEFTMLDPYYRLNLTSAESDGTSQFYRTTFMIPDQHGMFSFILDYKRTGLSYVYDKQVVTVRHFGHNEFQRSFSIPNAWPYITSIAVVVVAWLALVFLWLFSGNDTSTTVGKKDN
ncbi:Dolichyl-diphosphooligosaccharide--protein glycosyltransferase subunit WBP1 [Lipomyces oligophaga]|uniref:Dolichyl-diphosphooligosaccharide--protein glycosyltransferase subunit WBP1 n=1 Tax=Lipomyces oligophaga TaxID=45792 RepID=UPI0034CE68C8